MFIVHATLDILVILSKTLKNNTNIITAIHGYLTLYVDTIRFITRIVSF
jgi:hypothetical protein